MAVTVLTDIILFGIFYPSADLLERDLHRFSAGMAILSLLLKPLSCFFVYQMYRERGGEYNVNFGECSNFISSQTNLSRECFRPENHLNTDLADGCRQTV